MNDAMHQGPMYHTISSMAFVVRPRLLLQTRLVLEQVQSDPQLVLETQLVYEAQLLLEEIW